MAVLLTINTFSGPILSFLLALCHIYEQFCSPVGLITKEQLSNLHKTITLDVLRVQSLQLGLPLMVYLIAATLFRNHLFVWTVFSPKLIYELYSYGLFVTFWMAYYGWGRITGRFLEVEASN